MIPCSVPPLGYDPATAVSMMDWERRILQVCRVAALQYIVGMRDIGADADWTAYISVVRAAGLDECLETMQTAYDARWRGIA